MNNPAPLLNSISPSNEPAGSAGFPLTVKGGNFIFGSTVFWNGSARTTTYISGSELQAAIPPTDLQAPGTASVTVVTAGPGGGTSSPATFTINPQASSVPTITSLSPQAAIAGGQQFALVVNGTNFVPNSVVTWNGSNLATSFSVLTNTQLQATVPAADLATAGTAQVAVLNSPPGGGLSNIVSFAINNPLPAITSISPATAQAGGSTFTLTVNGTGFACAVEGSTSCSTPASVINWNGGPQTTTFVNASQLTTSIDASLIVSAQAVEVTVTNPPPGGGTSPPVVFNVIPSSSGGGLPELVDISTAGSQASSGIGNPGRSGPRVVGGGRFIAFSSVSQNLVPGLTNNVANVFLRDACTGASSCTPSTTLVSLATSGSLSNADSLDPSVSSDGRFVVFTSAATTLVPGATNGLAQIYQRDNCTGVSSGCTPSTTLVSAAPEGVTPGNDASSQPFISSDDHFIVFASTATNLVSGASIPAGVQEIYLRTTCVGATSGCAPTTMLVSLRPDGATPADGISSGPVVVAGGRFVAFSSTATKLVSLASGGIQQVYWRDTCTGASGCTPATALVSVASGGSAAGNAASSAPSLGSDGRFVVFASAATNLVSPNLPSATPAQIYQRDTCTGVSSGCAPATVLVSAASDGVSPAGGAAVEPATDSTGRFVAFSSAATNITSAANNGQAQIFVRDTCAEASGCTPKTALVSQSASSALGNGPSSKPAVDGGGHFAAFVSFASNLVANDVTPALDDVFLAITTF